MNKEINNFIQTHINKPLAEIALLLGKNKTLPKEYILNQINGRRRAKEKYPFLLDFPNFKFPNQRALAQSSSEETAKYKAKLFAGTSLLDLSGGMGLDSYFFSKQFENVDYVEQNDELARITSNNFKILGSRNIDTHSTSAENLLANNSKKYDCIYIDPDRRAKKSKAFKISECEPNVEELLPKIWELTENFLIKLSPMLDIKQALSELPNCKKVNVVALNNDCKELLFLLQKDFTGTPTISSVNLNKVDLQKFKFTFEQEQSALSTFNEPQQFLYEPNVAILKAGAFKLVGAQFGLNKLAVNTHLYTSEVLKSDFPGRVLKIESISKPKKGLVEKANVVSRNFPQKPEQIKKKYKVKDGGSTFLYACTSDSLGTIFIIATALKN